MPRFHFDIRAGQAGRPGEARPDPAGTDLPDLLSARAEALRLAGTIVGDAAARAHLGEDWRIEVTDEAGLPLFVLEFSVPEGPEEPEGPEGPAPAARPLRH